MTIDQRGRWNGPKILIAYRLRSLRTDSLINLVESAVKDSRGNAPQARFKNLWVLGLGESGFVPRSHCGSVRYFDIGNSKDS